MCENQIDNQQVFYKTKRQPKTCNILNNKGIWCSYYTIRHIPW